MIKRIAILIEESYQDLEVWYPYYRLREAGMKPIFIGSGSREVYPGKFGYPCPVEMTIDQVQVDDFDAVIIPGGWAPDYIRRYPAMNQFVAAMNAAQKVVAAICHGGWVLCSAKILEGRRATSFSAIADDMIHAGANWIDEETVVDGNLITARKPDDLPAFTLAIIQKLGA